MRIFNPHRTGNAKCKNTLKTENISWTLHIFRYLLSLSRLLFTLSLQVEWITVIMWPDLQCPSLWQFALDVGEKCRRVKQCSIVHKCLHRAAPSCRDSKVYSSRCHYLAQQHMPRQSACVFAVSGPCVWNDQSQTLQHRPTHSNIFRANWVSLHYLVRPTRNNMALSFLFRLKQ